MRKKVKTIGREIRREEVGREGRSKRLLERGRNYLEIRSTDGKKRELDKMMMLRRRIKKSKINTKTQRKRG